MSVQRDREQAEHQEGPDDFGPIPKSRVLKYVELAEAWDRLQSILNLYGVPAAADQAKWDAAWEAVVAARAALEENR